LIEVVKGAAAIQLFGPEAKDGVIQIFMKDGASAASAPDAVPQAEPAGGIPVGAMVYLDGALFEGDVSTLDPATIARVDVVKRVTAGSIIRVTTKKAAGGGGGA